MSETSPKGNREDPSSLLARAVSIVEDFEKQKGVSPTPDMLAKYTGVPRREITNILANGFNKTLAEKNLPPVQNIVAPRGD
ncbi:hypothetical protein KKF38_04105 [Patescibacteria group bacterium]|nr:hypothetical protein [Patescibacteria group bacterium]